MSWRVCSSLWIPTLRENGASTASFLTCRNFVTHIIANQARPWCGRMRAECGDLSLSCAELAQASTPAPRNIGHLLQRVHVQLRHRIVFRLVDLHRTGMSE